MEVGGELFKNLQSGGPYYLLLKEYTFKWKRSTAVGQTKGKAGGERSPLVSRFKDILIQWVGMIVLFQIMFMLTTVFKFSDERDSEFG